MRKYEAAKVSRHTSDWTALGTSANAEIGSSFAAVRNRVRQMVRDNEYAARGLEALVTYRSEEHTSELQSLMRISYAVFCLKKKNKQKIKTPNTNINYVHTMNNANLITQV